MNTTQKAQNLSVRVHGQVIQNDLSVKATDRCRTGAIKRRILRVNHLSVGSHGQVRTGLTVHLSVCPPPYRADRRWTGRTAVLK